MNAQINKETRIVTIVGAILLGITLLFVSTSQAQKKQFVLGPKNNLGIYFLLDVSGSMKAIPKGSKKTRAQLSYEALQSALQIIEQNAKVNSRMNIHTMLSTFDEKIVSTPIPHRIAGASLATLMSMPQLSANSKRTLIGESLLDARAQIDKITIGRSTNNVPREWHIIVLTDGNDEAKKGEHNLSSTLAYISRQNMSAQANEVRTNISIVGFDTPEHLVGQIDGNASFLKLNADNLISELTGLIVEAIR